MPRVGRGGASERYPLGGSITVIELPRCAVCRVRVDVGQNVVFRRDGRVQHVECPKVVCPACELPVLPTQPIRRNGERQIHAHCWMRLNRSK